MTAQQAKTNRNEQARYEVRDRMAQSAAEGAALRGELGPGSQLTAMAEVYRELRAAGRLAEAAEVKAAAMVINNQLKGE